MSLDIQIKVDPGNSAQAADKVTASLHKAEDQGAKTQKEFDKLNASSKQMAQGIDSAARGIGKLNLKQAAQGASQAFELLNSKLHLTDTALGDAVTSAVKFGAAGMQMAGPWGAALGSLIGLASALGDELYSWLDDGKHERYRAQLDEEIERNKQIIDLLKEQKAIYAQVTDETERLGVARVRAFNDIVAGARFGAGDSAAEKVRALETALFQARQERSMINDRRAAAGSSPLGPDKQELDIARQLKDAMIELDVATGKYGKTTGDLRTAQAHRIQMEVQLKKDLDAGYISQSEYNKALGITVRQTKALQELRNNLDTVSLPGATAGFKPTIGPNILLPGEGSGFDSNQSITDMMGNDWGLKIDESVQSTKELKEELSEIDKMLRDQLVNSAVSFGDALIDSIGDAEFSWSKWIGKALEDLAKMSLRLGVSQMFGGALGFATGGGAMMTPGGLQRIPGAATGMDAIMGGAGSTDSRLAMLRMTPGESLHVRTPEQRAAAQRSQGGGTVVQNHVHFDRRDLLAAIGTTEGKAAIVNVISSSPGLVRAILGR